MWSITFYSVAPLVLCVMIMNAAEPVIDYSHLHKPTATVSTYPPLAAPAPRVQSPQAGGGGGGGGGAGHYILNSHNSPKERSLLAFLTKWLSSVTSSPVSFIKHLSRRSSSFPSSTAEIDLDEISTDFNAEEIQQQEKRPPSRSRYSPPAAAYYAEDESIRQHHIYLQQQHQQQQQQHPQQQQQSVHPDSPSFNKSELWHSAAGTKVPTPQAEDNNNNNHNPQTRNLDDPGKIPVGDWHLVSALHNKPLP